jgi:hypothetical protein
LLRYALDYVAGHIRDRRMAVDLNLIVYERGTLDMLVEQTRYGRGSQWMMRLLVRILPQPDLVVFLDLPERLRQQNPELGANEVKRRLGVWTRLADDGAIHMVLPADGAPQVLAQRIVEGLMERFMRGH